MGGERVGTSRPCFPYNLPINVLSFQLHSLRIARNAGLTKQTFQPVPNPCSVLHNSQVGSPLPGHSWSPSNVKCLNAFHLATFGSILKRPDWRELYGPRALQGAVIVLWTHFPLLLWFLLSCQSKLGILRILASTRPK